MSDNEIEMGYGAVDLVSTMQLDGISLRKLHLYWENLSPVGGLPAWKKFDPIDVFFVLDSVVVVEVHTGAKRFYYRLAGDRVDTMFGMNFAGKWLDDLQIPNSDGYWTGNYARAAETKEPLSGRLEKFDPDMNFRRCEWLMLPFLVDSAESRFPETSARLIILAALDFEP